MLTTILDKKWGDMRFEGSEDDERKSSVHQRRGKRRKPHAFRLLRGVVIDEAAAVKKKRRSLGVGDAKQSQRLRQSTARQRILKDRRALCYDSDKDQEFMAKISQVVVEPASFSNR